MAKGYTKIENDLLDFLYSNNLKVSELKVLIFIIRYTKGFNRDTTRASYGYIANGVGCTKESVRRAIKSLEKKKYIKIEYEAKGSAAQIIKLLYNNCWRSCTTSVVHGVQQAFDDNVQQALYQDIKEEIKDKEIKEKERDFQSNEEEHEVTDEEWKRMLAEQDDDW